jgi:hypothetical protein
MKLFTSHDSGYEFDRLTQVGSNIFCVFFKSIYQFQLHPSILGLLMINLHNFFQSIFYEVTSVS